MLTTISFIYSDEGLTSETSVSKQNIIRCSKLYFPFNCLTKRNWLYWINFWIQTKLIMYYLSAQNQTNPIMKKILLSMTNEIIVTWAGLILTACTFSWRSQIRAVFAAVHWLWASAVPVSKHYTSSARHGTCGPSRPVVEAPIHFGKNNSHQSRFHVCEVYVLYKSMIQYTNIRHCLKE